MDAATSRAVDELVKRQEQWSLGVQEKMQSQLVFVNDWQAKQRQIDDREEALRRRENEVKRRENRLIKYAHRVGQMAHLHAGQG